MLQRFYAEKYAVRREQYPRAFIADRLSLGLPLFPQMTEGEQATVVAALAAGGS